MEQDSLIRNQQEKENNMNLKLMLVILLATLIFSMNIIGNRNTSSGSLSLEIKASKVTYALGEPVDIGITLTNTSQHEISLTNALHGRDGYLKILISKDGKNYLDYIGARWGKDDSEGKPLTLSPGQEVTNFERVLWNSKPEIPSSISLDVAQRAKEGKILSFYAFPDPGTYLVKASYSIQVSDQKDPLFVESEPVTVQIDSAKGQDLAVWEKIKDRGDIAYFLQESDITIPSDRNKDRIEFKSLIDQIITEYPESFYAASLKQSLDKFRTSEAKREEAKQKLQKKNQN